MEVIQTNARKRTGWIWVIFIFYCISIIVTLASTYLVFSGKIDIKHEQMTHITNFSYLDIGVSIFIGLLYFSGAISLFLLRRLAIYFFSGGLVASILNSTMFYIKHGFYHSLGKSGIVGVTLGKIISILILYYTWKLIKGGVLK